MTTKVTIEACCGEEYEVRVYLDEGEVASDKVLQDGETHEVYVYGERSVMVSEHIRPVVPTWQERVVDEKEELDEKIGKLGAFLHTPECETLPEGDRSLLIRQFETMCEYNNVLSELIESF